MGHLLAIDYKVNEDSYLYDYISKHAQRRIVILQR